MTNSNISTNAASAGNNGWKLYLYAKDSPRNCEVVSRDTGETISVGIKAGSKVQFKLKKASISENSNANVVEFKFVCSLRSFYSQEEPLAQSPAFYRALAIARFSPANGRYIVGRIKLDGEPLFRKGGGELVEYFYNFIGDCINDAVYDENTKFEGSEVLMRIPSNYKHGTTASQFSDITSDLPGMKLFDLNVDGGKDRISFKKLKDDRAGFVTNDFIYAFDVKHVGHFVDKQDHSFHTNRGDKEHPLVKRVKNETELARFVKEFC